MHLVTVDTHWNNQRVWLCRPDITPERGRGRTATQNAQNRGDSREKKELSKSVLDLDSIFHLNFSMTTGIMKQPNFKKH